MHAWGIFCIILAVIVPVAGAVNIYDQPISPSSAISQFHLPAINQVPSQGAGTITWNGVTVPVPQFLPPLTPVNLTPATSPLSEFYGNLDWNQTSDSGWDYLFKNKPLPRGVKWVNYPPSDWI